MAYPQKLLAPDETIQFETKPHWRALFVPAIVMLITVFVTVFLLSWVVSNISGWEFLRWVVIGGLLSSTLVWADLPTMEAPSRGEGSGLIDTIKNYAYDGGILLGLLIATLAFLGVAWHSLTVYADVQNQRKTWKDLGAVVGVGALLVVVILWFLTKAATIL